jgi:hypothetical protein
MGVRVNQNKGFIEKEGNERWAYNRVHELVDESKESPNKEWNCHTTC